jgi:Holliday junction resolvasome RuvABC endonuclease subunit
MNLPIVLGVDPSVKNLGWAVCNIERGSSDYYDLDGGAWTFGLIHPKGRNLQYKWKDAFFQLRAILEADDHWPSHFASEWPSFFNSMKGRLAAQQNYTVDIASIVGFLAGQFNFRSENITLWTPNQWKGSVPKYVTEHKFVRVFGQPAKKLVRVLSDDVVDAIMITHFWLTIYDRHKFSWQQYERKEVSQVCH